METVEDTLDTELEAFLARPLFCHLGTASEEGPRVSPLWFLWEEGAIWIIATLSNKTFPGPNRGGPPYCGLDSRFRPRDGARRARRVAWARYRRTVRGRSG